MRIKDIALFYVLILLLAILGSAVSCSKSGNTNPELAKADALVWDYPDSALMILEGIDTFSLKRDEERALYGLLYTMALDKNHMDPRDESLIIPSVNFYHRKGDKQNEIKATYYHGRVQYLSGDYPRALVSFFKAKEMAEKQSDYFWAGMACRGISDSFLQTSSSADELIYAKKEFEYLQKSGVQPYVNYALLDLCRAYNNIDSVTQTLAVAQQIMDSATLYQDNYLLFEAKKFNAYNLMWIEKYDEASPVLKTVIESCYANSLDSLYYSWSLIELGKLIDFNDNLISSFDLENPLSHLVKSKIYNNLGEIEMSLQELQKMNNLINNKLQSQREISLSSSLADYFEVKKHLDELEKREQVLKIWFLICLTFLLLLFTILFILYLKKQYKNELIRKEIILDELRNSLDEIEFKDSKSSKIINLLLKSQNKIISDFGEILRFSPKLDIAKKNIGKKVDELINLFSIKGNMLPKMENQINEIYDNLFINFREDLPDLKEIDYALYLYSILGFSLPAITVFIGESRIESLYNRKRRLKDKINTLSPDKKSKYLKLL